MRRVFGPAVAIFAAAISCLFANDSHADMFRHDDDTLLFFSGTDLWRQGSFSFAAYGRPAASTARVSRSSCSPVQALINICPARLVTSR